MFIIDEKGKVIEGQQLTEEEVSIIEELNAPDGIYSASSQYIQHESVTKISAYLIGKFEMKRRVPVPQAVEVPELVASDVPEPVALEVEALPSA
jgi:hypothetical protein